MLTGNPVLAWRDDTTLQIGWGVHSLVVEDAPPGLPRWLRMAADGRSRDSLLAAARSEGIPQALASALLIDLARVGLGDQPPPLRAAVHRCGLLLEPLCTALRAAGVEIEPAADVLVFVQGQVPSLLAAPQGVRRLVPLWFPARAVHVGPVLDSDRGPCPLCIERAWADCDPDWVGVAAQASSVSTWVDPAQVTLAAGLVAHIAAAPATVGLEMIMDPCDPGPSWRVWRAHPECGCQQTREQSHRRT